MESIVIKCRPEELLLAMLKVKSSFLNEGDESALRSLNEFIKEKEAKCTR